MTHAGIVVETLPAAVDLYGYGRIGLALRERLQAQGTPCASVYTSSGPLEQHPVVAQRRILVDATTPRYEGPLAEAWVGRLREALGAGTSVVTCNKAPLATSWATLQAAAEQGSSALGCSATVGGGLPVLRFLDQVSRAHGIESIEATLSGTLSFLLGRIGAGSTLQEALEGAQRAGFAEPDPTLDLDGTDAFAKAAIIHNLVFVDERPITLQSRRAAFALDAQEVARLRREGLFPQVIARIVRGEVTLGLEGARPGTWPPLEPGHIALQVRTESGATFLLTGAGAGVQSTARILAAQISEFARDGVHTRGIVA